jgi:hypothetical protein
VHLEAHLLDYPHHSIVNHANGVFGKGLEAAARESFSDH